jgi:hypothetical protein
MNTLFDSAGLAIVAYAEVLADGSSVATNSGVATTKIGTGQYRITLPVNKTQDNSRDLIFVTPKAYPLSSGPLSHAVDDRDPANKDVAIYGVSPIATFADAPFSVIILRTIIPQ